MPQTNAPKGLIPVRHINGSPWNGQVQAFLHPSGDAVAIYVGDPVQTLGSSAAAGTIVAGQDCEGMMTVARDTSGTTGQATLGVAVGFSVDPTNLMKRHCAASENRIVYVVTDPTVVYEVQEDAAGTPIAAASVGLNASLITTAGSTTTGNSGMMLDSSAVATTATLPLKLIGLVKRPDVALSTGTTDYAKWEVVWNTGFFAPNLAGTA